MDFKFQQFGVQHSQSTMKVGTDAILLGSWARVQDDANVIDVGCGCGIIALMLAQRAEEADITAIDIDEDSIAEAKRNFIHSPWGDRLSGECISYLAFAAEKYDHIVSNPPFFSGDKKSIYPSRTKSRHTVYLSHYEFIVKSLEMIHERSKISVILPAMIGSHFIDMAEQNGLFLNRRCKISPYEWKAPNRVLLEFSMNKSALQDQGIYVYCRDGSYSESFEKLTKAFYL